MQVEPDCGKRVEDPTLAEGDEVRILDKAGIRIQGRTLPGSGARIAVFLDLVEARQLFHALAEEPEISGAKEVKPK